MGTLGAALSTTGEVALELLRLIASAAGVFAPIKSVAAAALHIGEIVEACAELRLASHIVDIIRSQEFHLNKNQWREFGAYVQDATASIIESLSKLNGFDRDTRNKLEQLKTTLDTTAAQIESQLVSPWYKRVWRIRKDRDTIAHLRRKVDNSLSLFHFSLTVTTFMDLRKIVDDLKFKGEVDGRLEARLDSVIPAIVISPRSTSSSISLSGMI
ncbi:hypothetical protein FRC07_001962 [Ceratobasidium sp. 392]|nr:hypothetical protein FRC07_001962 [Ceratobasidium sp. 392]